MGPKLATGRRLGVLLAGMVAMGLGCDIVPLFGARTGPGATTGTGGVTSSVGSSVGSELVDGIQMPPDEDQIDVLVMEAYLACLDGCTTGVVGDRATCRLACASSSLDEVPNLSAGAKTCMLPCLETLARCSQVCETTPTPPDDEAACELQCQSAGAVCLSHCVEQNQSE